MVTKLDRLARSLPDARAIAEDLTRRKVRLSLGGSVYDPTDPVGRLLFNVLAMVAEFEADLIRSRTKEGMRVAKAKGHLRGKQPKLNPRQEAHLVELLASGEYTTGEVGELFGVARSTVYRAVARAKRRATADAARESGRRPAAGVPTTPFSPTNSAPAYRPRRGLPSELPSENRARRCTLFAARKPARKRNTDASNRPARAIPQVGVRSRRKRFLCGLSRRPPVGARLEDGRPVSQESQPHSAWRLGWLWPGWQRMAASNRLSSVIQARVVVGVRRQAWHRGPLLRCAHVDGSPVPVSTNGYLCYGVMLDERSLRVGRSSPWP